MLIKVVCAVFLFVGFYTLLRSISELKGNLVTAQTMEGEEVFAHECINTVSFINSLLSTLLICVTAIAIIM